MDVVGVDNKLRARLSRVFSVFGHKVFPMYEQQELLPGNVTDPSLGQPEPLQNQELGTVDLH